MKINYVDDILLKMKDNLLHLAIITSKTGALMIPTKMGYQGTDFLSCLQQLENWPQYNEQQFSKLERSDFKQQ